MKNSSYKAIPAGGRPCPCASPNHREFSSVNTSVDYVPATIALMTVTVLQWLVITRLTENIRNVQRNEQAQEAANDALRLSKARYRLVDRTIVPRDFDH